MDGKVIHYVITAFESGFVFHGQVKGMQINHKVIIQQNSFFS